jgi:hypothetical protein
MPREYTDGSIVWYRGERPDPLNRYANQANFDAAIAKLLKKVGAERGITQNELGIELQKIVALGIDATLVCPDSSAVPHPRDRDSSVLSLVVLINE